MYQYYSTLFQSQLFYNLYSGGLGTSMLTNLKLPFYNVSNINWDLVLCPGITLGIGRQNRATFIRVFNFMSAPVSYHNYSTSLTLSHLFILNKFRKNQRSGSINMNFGYVSLGYFNDIMDQIFTFEGLGMGDGHDRYWTGGGYLNIQINDRYEIFYEFDRFTGFGGKLFEISNKLRLNNTFYKTDSLETMEDVDDPYKNQSFANRGLFSFGLRRYFENYYNWYAKISNIGDSNFDIQNIIHRKLSKNPVHNTQTIDLWQLSYGFQYLLNRIDIKK